MKAGGGARGGGRATLEITSTQAIYRGGRLTKELAQQAAELSKPVPMLGKEHKPRTWDLQPRKFGTMVLPAWTPSTPHSTTSLQYAHMSAAEIVRTRGEQARSRHRAAAAAATAPEGEVVSRRERYSRRSGAPPSSTAAGAAGTTTSRLSASASASASSLGTPLPTDDALDGGVAGGRDGFGPRGSGGTAPRGRGRPGRPSAASRAASAAGPALLPGVSDHDADGVGAAAGGGLASFLDASGDDASLAAAGGAGTGGGVFDVLNVDGGTASGADIFGSAAFPGALSSRTHSRLRTGSLDAPPSVEGGGGGGLDTSMGVGDFSADMGTMMPLLGDSDDDDEDNDDADDGGADDAREAARGAPAAKRRRLGEPPADE